MTEILSNLLGQYVEFEFKDSARGQVGMVWAVYNTSRDGPAAVLEIVDPGYSSYYEVGDLILAPVASGMRIVTQCPVHRPELAASAPQQPCTNAGWFSKGKLAEHIKTFHA